MRLPRLTSSVSQIIALAIAGVGFMGWAVLKFAIVIEEIQAAPHWLYFYIAVGITGSLLILAVAYRELRWHQKLHRIDDELEHFEEMAKQARREEGAYPPDSIQ